MKYISPFYFFISFAIGILYVYLITPPPEIIIKYPVPDDSDNTIYKDYAGLCYKYNSKEVDCGLYKNKLKDMEIQYNGRIEEEKSYINKLFSSVIL